MTVALQIDFVSDVACPWCAIGLASLEEALRRSADRVTAELSLQPFELNPGVRPEGQNIEELLGSRYGSDPAQLEQMRQSVRARAAEVGITFNQNRHSRIYNTFDAHRLLHWSKDKGRQLALKRALFRANFTDGANIADHEVLVAAASAAGLDPTEARGVLASGAFGAEVREAERYWQSSGIRAVPGIVINQKWLISGGQPPEQFEAALRQIAAELAVPGEAARPAPVGR